MYSQADLGIEDLEDVDDVLEKEMKAIGSAGLGPSLAAKLAQFEALTGNED